MKFRNLLTNLEIQWFYRIIIFAVGLLAYSAILTIGTPSKINLILSTHSTFLFIVIAGLLYLAYRPAGWIGSITSFSATLILFATQLSAVWRSGVSNGMIFGGFLPSSDAINYYTGALNLLEGKTLANTTFIVASWRPFFSGTLATLLGITQQNLQVTLAIFVFVNAIAAFFLAREVQRSHGTVAGVLSLTLIFLYYSDFTGIAMTEHLGLALGTVGLAILWRGALNQSFRLCLLGIFLLTLALNARAGAYFILPALILWGTLLFRGTSRFSKRFLLSGVSVVLLGFILNSIVFKVASSTNAVPNANFFYTLYGLIVGGDWMTIRIDYPEIFNLAEPERSYRFREVAIEALRAHPLGLVKGAIRAWKQFLFDDFVFSFVKNVKVNFSLQILSLIALVNCYRQRNTPISSLMLAAMAGILLSVPFVPPWDTGTRAYATTIPFVSILPALGLTFIAQKMEWRKLLSVPKSQQQSKVVLTFAIALALLSVGGPIITKIFSHSPQFTELSCPVGTEVIYFRNSAGSSINLVDDQATRRTNVPNVRISDFKAGLGQLDNSMYREAARELNRLSFNMTLRNTTDLKTGKLVWLISGSRIIPKEKGIVGVCGKPTNNPATAKNALFKNWPLPVFLFYADSMTLVSR